MTSYSEKSPLLGDKSSDSFKNSLGGISDPTVSGRWTRSVTGESGEIKLKKNVKLRHAIAVLVGNVIGSGIFISVTGVTGKAGSAGASLIIWAAAGLLTLVQALCYAELGCLLPVTGGDYSYTYYLLGPLPAFMVAWIHIIIIGPSSMGAIAQTAGLYLTDTLNLDCHQGLITAIAILIAVSLLAVNAYSVKWGINVQNVLSVTKVLALTVIIITGIVQLIKGSRGSLESPFAGTKSDVGLMALAVLDGYYAYKGWEGVNTLPEEMTNPKRDLPLAVWISIFLITGVYIMTNVAYFAVLTIPEILESDAVGLTFAQQTLGKAAPVISICVTLSCIGAVNGSYLTDAKYWFAGGRYRQLPYPLAMLSFKYYTPIPAMIMNCVTMIIYACIPSLDQLLEFASLGVQLKVTFVLVALLYLKWKRPDLERPVSVHWSICVLTFIAVLALVGLGIWKNPATIAAGVGIFIAGIPVYFIIQFLKKLQCSESALHSVSDFVQKSLLVVPETGEVDAGFNSQIKEKPTEKQSIDKSIDRSQDYGSGQ